MKPDIFKEWVDWFEPEGNVHELHACWKAALVSIEREHFLLLNVLNQARETLLISINGTPEELQRSLGKLSFACKAHWDWQTEKMKRSGELS